MGGVLPFGAQKRDFRSGTKVIPVTFPFASRKVFCCMALDDP
jgi:hypothetical protein